MVHRKKEALASFPQTSSRSGVELGLGPVSYTHLDVYKRQTLDGTLGNDLQQNWRLGGTLAFPVNRYNSIKLYASSGVSARTGNNFDLVGIAWQYRWGAGL